MNRDRLTSLYQHIHSLKEICLDSYQTCPGGIAATLPEFIELGLKTYLSPRPYTPCYLSEQGFKALALFFDISISQSVNLFCPTYVNDTSRHRQIWLERCERILDDK